MKYWFLYIKLFFLIPVILLLLIIRIFKNFKINKIESHTVGEMITPIEIYICEKKDDPNIIDYATFGDRSDFLDVYLVSMSCFK